MIIELVDDSGGLISGEDAMDMENSLSQRNIETAGRPNRMLKIRAKRQNPPR